MLAPSLSEYPGKAGEVLTGESEKPEGDCIGLPAQEARHSEAEALIPDRNVVFTVFSTEQREENSSGYLNVCRILQQGFLLAQR